MSFRELYEWHFSELLGVTADNLIFSKLAFAMGLKEGYFTAKLDHLLTPPMIEEVRKLAHISIGTQFSDSALEYNQSLATQVIELIEFWSQISEDVLQRIHAIAMNLNKLISESASSLHMLGQLANWQRLLVLQYRFSVQGGQEHAEARAHLPRKECLPCVGLGETREPCQADGGTTSEVHHIKDGR